MRGPFCSGLELPFKIATMRSVVAHARATDSSQFKDGFVTFTMHFKYLGSFISYNLRDDFDIDTRIKKAGAAMGALKHFFNNKHVDTYTKHLIFKAIPLNLLLWGCEAWSLREDHYIKLESFLHRSIRNILNINMTQVQEDHIKNEIIRETFYGIRNRACESRTPTSFTIGTKRTVTRVLVNVQLCTIYSQLRNHSTNESATAKL